MAPEPLDDLTNESRPHERTEEHTRRLQLMFEQAPGFMAMLRGPEHRFELVNKAYRQIVGHRELIGKTVREALPEIEGQGFFELLDSVFATGEAFVGQGLPVLLQRTPGSDPEQCAVNFVYQPVFEGGQVTGIFVEGFDVTDAHNNLVALKNNQIHLRALLDSAGEAFYAVDRTGVTTLCNTAFVQALGFGSTEEPLGRKLHDVIHHTHRDGKHYPKEDCPIYQCAQTGNSAHVVDELFFRLDGTSFPVEYRVGPIYVEGELQGAICTFVDITARKRAEEELRQLNETLEVRIRERSEELLRAEETLRHSQKMEAIGQLTGGVAHDFNNLLTIIRSSVDLLRRRDLPEERKHRYIEAIGDTADRAAVLTSQLLAFARRQPLRAEVFDVVQGVQRAADMLRSIVGARIVLEVGTPPQPCWVEADINQFETALINLAVNARDAMGGAGKLGISVARISGISPVRGHAGAEGDFIAVTVEDSGPGISHDLLDRIFEPFYTTKEVGKGTGLGLSQVYGFTKQSGGEVLAESSAGEGARFTLYLPHTDRLPPPVEPFAGESGPLGQRRGRILVVEDNEQVGEFASSLLQDLGHTTTRVGDAASALSAVDMHPQGFDLVFSDVVMPGAMNGVDLAEELRRKHPNLPVVLTTGYSDVLATGAGAGFELLRKPYSVETLSRLMRKMLA